MQPTSMGERFGNYEVLRRLAAGGMAEVLLAKQQGLAGFERLVCIKRILPHLSGQEEFLKMFQDEARIAANLIHPNVAQIYDIGQHEGHYYIAMEYVRGEDLRRVYNQEVSGGRSIPLHVAASIIMGAASGLHYAHRQTDLDGVPLAIVHRDISPQNILVTYDGHVKVIDFGVAKAAGKLNQTRAGVLKGKYSYMSPEQASGDPVDARTDIFALGTTLYEITTGTRLFKRDNELETLHAVIACNVPKPSEVVPGYDTDLEAIVLKALAYDAGSRYQSAGELERELEQYLHAHRHATSASALAQYMQTLFAERLAEAAATQSAAKEATPAAATPAVTAATNSSAPPAGEATKHDEAAQPPPLPVAVDDEQTTVDEQAPPPRPPQARPAPAVHNNTSTATPSEWHVVDATEQTGSTRALDGNPSATFLPAREAAEVQREADAAWREIPAAPTAREVQAAQGRGQRRQTPRKLRLVALTAMAAAVAGGLTLWQRRRDAAAPAVAVTTPGDHATVAEAAKAREKEGASEGPTGQHATTPRPLPAGMAGLSVEAPLPMTVTLGGRYLGETPLRDVAVPPGNVHLKLESRQEGLTLWRRLKLVRAQTQQVQVDGGRGRLRVQAKPWAWVQRGQYAASETPRDDEVVAGEYVLILECPDGRRREQSTLVRAGAATNVALDCE